MGKINMGIFYGKKYNPRNRTFSLENGENFIEGTGPAYWQKTRENSNNKFKIVKLHICLSL